MARYDQAMINRVQTDERTRMASAIAEALTLADHLHLADVGIALDRARLHAKQQGCSFSDAFDSLADLTTP